MTSDFRPETVVAIEAVERALELTRARVGADEVRQKGPRDLVTAADVAVEEAIRGLLGEAFPVVGEEGGGESEGGAHWIVDPICGTRNFAFRHPALLRERRARRGGAGRCGGRR